MTENSGNNIVDFYLNILKNKSELDNEKFNLDDKIIKFLENYFIKKEDIKNFYLKKIDLINEVKRCLENGKVSDNLCRMFYLIAKNMSRGYVFNEEDKNDMIQKAVEFCIKYFKKINIEKDPFAYVTQICKHAFYQFFNSENRYNIFVSDMLVNANKEFEKKYKNK